MDHVKIDLERVVSDIDRNIFGGYLENLVYGGIYYPKSPYADKNGLRTDVIEALERMKCPNLRFPGGNFAVRLPLDGRNRAVRRASGPARPGLEFDCLQPVRHR